jgi:hypothetical protein
MVQNGDDDAGADNQEGEDGDGQTLSKSGRTTLDPCRFVGLPVNKFMIYMAGRQDKAEIYPDPQSPRHIGVECPEAQKEL